jgi:hypothetical protein
VNNQEFLSRIKTLLRREEINDRLKEIIEDMSICMVEAPHLAPSLWAKYQSEIEVLKAEFELLKENITNE